MHATCSLLQDLGAIEASGAALSTQQQADARLHAHAAAWGSVGAAFPEAHNLARLLMEIQGEYNAHVQARQAERLQTWKVRWTVLLRGLNRRRLAVMVTWRGLTWGSCRCLRWLLWRVMQRQEIVAMIVAYVCGSGRRYKGGRLWEWYV